MSIFRYTTGFFQAFLIVYFPIWVDTFGEAQKTRWLTFLQLGVLLGVIIGYVLTGMFNVLHEHVASISWRWSFYIQALFLCAATYVIHLSEERDLSTNGILSGDGSAKHADTFENYPVLRMSLFSRSPSLLLTK